MMPRIILGDRQEQRSDAAFTDMTPDCDGVQPGNAGARPIEHERITRKLSAFFSNDDGGVPGGEEMTKASS